MTENERVGVSRADLYPLLSIWETDSRAAGIPELKSFLSGSVMYFGKGSDVDLLVLTNLSSEGLASACNRLVARGWTAPPKRQNPTNRLVRKHALDVILYNDPVDYELMTRAGRVCKLLADRNLLRPEDKSLSVGIHEIIKQAIT